MNFKEILAQLKKLGYTGEGIGEGLPASLEKIGKIELKEDVGGEGEGDHRHIVYYLEDHDVFIRLNGYYTSYDGTTWNDISDLHEVFPQQRVITVFERRW